MRFLSGSADVRKKEKPPMLRFAAAKKATGRGGMIHFPPMRRAMREKKGEKITPIPHQDGWGGRETPAEGLEARLLVTTKEKGERKQSR